MRRTVRGATLVALAMAVVACGGDAGPGDPGAGSAGSDAARTLPRPASLAQLPQVELVAPSPLEAGLSPTFEWRPAADAAAYRLTVLGPAGLRWAWQGSDTAIRYGGVVEGATGPSLVAGSWWSVAALAADGSLVALSELRSVSPASDPGPAPAWTTAAPAGPEPTAAAAGDVPPAERACDFLSASEIGTAIKGEWGEPEAEVYPHGKGGACTWSSVNGSELYLSIGPAALHDPEGWGADVILDDLGETGYVVDHGWDRSIGWLHGDSSLRFVIDYTRVDMEGFLGLARLIEERLP